MSITCRITLQARDRLRLDVPGIATDLETSQWLMQLLLTIPGVMGVEVQPASESILVRHVGTLDSRTAILRALRRGSVPAVAGTAEQPQTAELPYSRAEVIHAMRGRVRLHIPGAGSDTIQAGVLAMFLCEQPGIRNVRLNRRAANAIIAFDPSLLDARSVVDLVTTYNPDSAAIARWQIAQRSLADSPIQHGRRRKVEVALAVAALALTLFAGASATWLIYALLLGSAGSIMQRTYKSFRTDRKLAIEAAAGVSMIIAGLFGALWISALIPLVLFGAPRFNTWVQANARRTGAAPSGSTRSRTARSAAIRAVAALPLNSSLFRLTPTHLTPPASAPEVQREEPALIPARGRAAEPAEIGQVYVGGGSASHTASSYSSTTWFVHADSDHTAWKAVE